MSESQQSVCDRVEAVRERIAAAAARAGRRAEAVSLVGVCKRQPVERIAAALRAGVSQLGENYVQEAERKQALLMAQIGDSPLPAFRWRMIGHLQRNKARSAARLFAAVDSVDRVELARELDRRAAAASRDLELCLQVNLSGESQKSGVAPEQLPALLEACAGLTHARVVGLMTIPAADPDPEAARPLFARLRALRDTLCEAPGGQQLRELSMGMSSDFEVAIEEGATIVRVGTALFGERGENA